MAEPRHAAKRFPCDNSAPALARRWAGWVLDSWRISSRRDDALLLLSELVTNAVKRCHVGVDVVIQPDDALRVEVFDDDAGEPPRLHVGEPLDEHGRGLQLVDAIADRWGYREVPPRQAVWFTV
jgi:anti-sigma regulatory factor (Ser/Thr protein kinase)